MRAGRNSLGSEAVRNGVMYRWVDEGEFWLKAKFNNSGLHFHTQWSFDDAAITLSVYRRVKEYDFSYSNKKIFEVTEKAENFVSHLTVTKILLIL